MDINENIRDKRKIIENSGGIPTKLPVYLLLS